MAKPLDKPSDVTHFNRQIMLSPRCHLSVTTATLYNVIRENLEHWIKQTHRIHQLPTLQIQ